MASHADTHTHTHTRSTRERGTRGTTMHRGSSSSSSRCRQDSHIVCTILPFWNHPYHCLIIYIYRERDTAIKQEIHEIIHITLYLYTKKSGTYINGSDKIAATITNQVEKTSEYELNENDLNHRATMSGWMEASDEKGMLAYA